MSIRSEQRRDYIIIVYLLIISFENKTVVSLDVHTCQLNRTDEPIGPCLSMTIVTMLVTHMYTEISDVRDRARYPCVPGLCSKWDET